MTQADSTSMPNEIAELMRRRDAGDILEPDEIQQLSAYGRCPECGCRADDDQGYPECGTFHAGSGSAESGSEEPGADAAAGGQKKRAETNRDPDPETSDDHAGQDDWQDSLNRRASLMSAFYDALTEPGDVREVRIPNPVDGRQGVIAGYFDNRDAFVNSVMPYTTTHLAESVYTTLNPVNPALLARAANRLKTHTKLTTTDKDIPVRRYCFIDVDPVRPAGVSATEAERAAALETAARIAAYLTELGWPDPVVNGSSGNGGMLIYRTEPLPADDASKALHIAVVNHVGERFDSAAVRVDRTVSNAARIVKIAGTVASKGDYTQERPYRIADPSINPGAGVVSRAQLDALAPPMDGTDQRQGDPAGSDQGEPTNDQGKTQRRIQAALDERGIGYDVKQRDGRFILDLAQCLTSNAHTRGAAITIFPSGAIAYSCRHDSCQGKGWTHVRERLGYGGKGEKPNDQRRTFHILTEAEYLDRPTRAWQIKGFVQDRSLVGIVGDFGSFKTFVAISMAKSIAHGLPWMDYDVKQGVALYVAGEGGTAIQKRLKAFNRHHGVGASPDFFMLPDAVAMIQGGQVDALIDAIRALPQVPTFIVLDTLARHFGPGNENTQEDMGRFVDAVGRLQSEFGATVVLVHHNNKQGEYRGSTALPGALDTMIQITAEKGGVTLGCEKQKDSEPFPTLRLKKVVVAIDGGADLGDGDVLDFDQATSLVFVPTGNAPGDDETPSVRLTKVERSALVALRDSIYGDLTQTKWAALAGVSAGAMTKLADRLVRDGYVSYTGGEGRGKPKFFAITDAGRLALEPIKNPFNGAQTDTGDGQHDAA